MIKLERIDILAICVKLVGVCCRRKFYTLCALNYWAFASHQWAS